jgi:5-(carboxyamino)imidazole ribonucleotide synthase
VPVFFNDSNAKIHLYGKAEVRPGRKMGHINIITKN